MKLFLVIDWEYLVYFVLNNLENRKVEVFYNGFKVNNVFCKNNFCKQICFEFICMQSDLLVVDLRFFLFFYLNLVKILNMCKSVEGYVMYIFKIESEI